MMTPHCHDTTAARGSAAAGRTARRRTAAAALVAGLATAAGPAAAASTDPAAIPPFRAALVERFATDPLSGRGPNPFFAEGSTDARFTYVANERPRFPGDRRGTLRVLYDTSIPSGRISTPLGRVLSAEENFAFGAVLTIRSRGFVADPEGFAQISFGLWNARTTGLGRALFPSDSFDLLALDYFPNLTAFGGPFLSPSAFGGAVGANAFDNFVFASTEVPLPFDVPLLFLLRHDGARRLLSVEVSRIGRGGALEPVPGAAAVADLARLRPGFLVDVAGIAAYFDGTAALRAEIDFDLLFVGDAPPPLRRHGAGDGGRAGTKVMRP